MNPSISENKIKIRIIIIIVFAILLLAGLIIFQQSSIQNIPSIKNELAETQPEEILRNGKFAKMTESDIQSAPDDKKVNLYIFWGDGCPHCEHLAEFLNSNTAKIKDKVSIYSFEVWNNKENNKFMKEFGKFLGESPKGVPFFIIGEEKFAGFSDTDKTIQKHFLDLIDSEYKKSTKIDRYQEYKKQQIDGR